MKPHHRPNCDPSPPLTGAASGVGDEEATLELTFIVVDGLRDASASFFPKTRYFAIAWLDPHLKISTKTLPVLRHRSSIPSPKLYFPISLQSLQNPITAITIQVLSSCFPFRGAKVVGSVVIPLSDLGIGGDVVAASLRRPSGRPGGVIRVSARVMWSLEVDSAADCFSGVPVGIGILGEVEGSDIFHTVAPSAPPMPLIAPPIVPLAPPVSSLDEEPVAPSEQRVGNGKIAWRSFLVGLLSGTVAAAFVGIAGSSEG